MGTYDERKTMEDLIRENADRFDPILRQLQVNNWNQMDGAERIGLLLELENLMADLQGRPPMQINIVMSIQIQQVTVPMTRSHLHRNILKTLQQVFPALTNLRSGML